MLNCARFQKLSWFVYAFYIIDKKHTAKTDQADNTFFTLLETVRFSTHLFQLKNLDNSGARSN